MSNVYASMKELNNILHRSVSNTIPLMEFYRRLCQILQANIYLFQPSGDIFCRACIPEFRCASRSSPYQLVTIAEEGESLGQVPDFYLKDFREEASSTYNLYEHQPRCDIEKVEFCEFTHRYYCVIPIYAGSTKESGVLIVRYGWPFNDEDIALCDYAGVVISLELSYRIRSRMRQEAWEQEASQMACSSLSAGELLAVKAVLDELGGSRGSLVLSDVAKRMYVTKSLITGALKKLESAGVFTTRSMGMKGMHIEVANDYLKADLERACLRLEAADKKSPPTVPPG